MGVRGVANVRRERGEALTCRKILKSLEPTYCVSQSPEGPPVVRRPLAALSTAWLARDLGRLREAALPRPPSPMAVVIRVPGRSAFLPALLPVQSSVAL